MFATCELKICPRVENNLKQQRESVYFSNSLWSYLLFLLIHFLVKNINVCGCIIFTGYWHWCCHTFCKINSEDDKTLFLKIWTICLSRLNFKISPLIDNEGWLACSPPPPPLPFSFVLLTEESWILFQNIIWSTCLAWCCLGEKRGNFQPLVFHYFLTDLSKHSSLKTKQQQAQQNQMKPWEVFYINKKQPHCVWVLSTGIIK